MDIIEILNGVQHFYEIVIPKAFYHTQWTEQNVINAFRWVKFCEEVYAKCTGENAKKLDELLHAVSCEIKCYKSPLCFQDLQQSSTLLTQAFFENPNVENAEIKNILEKNQLEANIYAENLIEVVTMDKLCYDLIESLKPISIKDSDRSFYYEIKAELFLEFLKNALKHLATEERESHLTSAFERMFDNEENMMILYHVFIHSPTDDGREIEVIQSLGLNLTLLKLYSDENCNLAHFLLNQPPIKLRILANKYRTFYDYYIKTLLKCAERLQEKESFTFEKWSSRAVSSNNLTLSSDQVLNHIQILVSVDDGIAKSTQEHILELMNSHPDKLIYKELSSMLSILKK